MSTCYLTNAFSLNMVDLNNKNSIEIDEVPYESVAVALRAYPVVNAIGHKPTDILVQQDLLRNCGLCIPEGNRLSIQFEKNDLMIVAQYVGPRLEEGLTVLPVGATIKYIAVYHRDATCVL